VPGDGRIDGNQIELPGSVPAGESLARFELSFADAVLEGEA